MNARKSHADPNATFLALSPNETRDSDQAVTQETTQRTCRCKHKIRRAQPRSRRPAPKHATHTPISVPSSSRSAPKARTKHGGTLQSDQATERPKRVKSRPTTRATLPEPLITNARNAHANTSAMFFALRTARKYQTWGMRSFRSGDGRAQKRQLQKHDAHDFDRSTTHEIWQGTCRYERDVRRDQPQSPVRSRGESPHHHVGRKRQKMDNYRPALGADKAPNRCDYRSRLRLHP